jgi:5-amino-6-(5-phosphoribosylamino)uracil reductase
VADRPYTLLSCCLSLDGYLDDSSEQRLILSGDADLDRVDSLRAGADAIMVGAATVRNDNPRLLVRSPERVAQRLASGLPATPAKVTVTALAKLDPGCAFFTSGETTRLVYCADETVDAARDALGRVATVVGCAAPLRMDRLCEDLHRRGIRRLLVEGGASVLSQYRSRGLADELQVAIAPILVGDSSARRFVDDGRYPWTVDRRAHLVETRTLDDVVLLRYALSARFDARHFDGRL